MVQVALVPAVVVLVASLAAAITDVWKFKVYNALTIPLLLSGVVYHTVTAGSIGVVGSVFGMLLGFAAFLIPYLLGIMGAGDVKLMAALGAWLGVPATSSVILIGCLLTLLYSVCVLLIRGGFGKLRLNFILSCYRIQAIVRHMAPDDEYETVQSMVQRREQRSRMIPFSLIIGVGVIVTLIALKA